MGRLLQSFAFLAAEGVPARLSRAALGLGAVGVSLALASFTPRLDAYEFIARNKLPAPQLRLWLVGAVLLSAVLPGLIAACFVMWKRERALTRVERTMALLGPLSLAFLGPFLFNWRAAQESRLLYLIVLAGFGVGLYALLVHCFDAMSDGVRGFAARLALPWWFWFALVVLSATAYSLYMAHLSIQSHLQIKTTAFDLGIYDNLMYNALEGMPFRSPVCFGPGDKSYLAGHAEFAMLMFLPIYALRPGVETMLMLQAVLIGAAAIPLYFTAKTFLPPALSAIIAIGFLLFAPLHGPQLYDFHWLPLALFFHFLLYYALAVRKRWLAVLCVMILFAFREDVAVGLCVLGLFLLVTGLRPGFGLGLAITSAVWFAFVRFYVMEKAGAWWFEHMYAGLFADGKASYASVLTTLLTNPGYALGTLLKEDKLVYLLHMLAPLALFPLRRPALWLLLLPGSVFTLLTTGYGPTLSISFQYTTHWIPYLFLALTLSLVALSREPASSRKLVAAALVLVVTLLSHSHNFGAILRRERFVAGFQQIDFGWTKEQARRYADLRRIVKQIPRKASIVASEYMTPHVSTRTDAYTLRQDPGSVEYIFISRRELVAATRDVLKTMLARDSYGVVDHVGEFFLFRKGHQNAETEGVVRSLGLRVTKKPKKPAPAAAKPEPGKTAAPPAAAKPGPAAAKPAPAAAKPAPAAAKPAPAPAPARPVAPPAGAKPAPAKTVAPPAAAKPPPSPAPAP